MFDLHILYTEKSDFGSIVGWSGGAMVLGKLPVPGRPTILITVGQGPTALAVGAGGGCLDVFTLIYPFFPLSPSLWETARYRLKYCLKGPLNPKQPTNQLVLLYFHNCSLNFRTLNLRWPSLSGKLFLLIPGHKLANCNCFGKEFQTSSIL